MTQKLKKTWDQGLSGPLKEAQVEGGSPPPLVCLLQIALEA